MTCRLIDRNPEIGDDAVTLTDNDAGGSISITMIFELHAIAIDDEYSVSRYYGILKIFFINNILHLQIRFIVHIHHIISSVSHDIIACGKNFSYS